MTREGVGGRSLPAHRTTFNFLEQKSEESEERQETDRAGSGGISRTNGRASTHLWRGVGSLPDVALNLPNRLSSSRPFTLARRPSTLTARVSVASPRSPVARSRAEARMPLLMATALSACPGHCRSRATIYFDRELFPYLHRVLARRLEGLSPVKPVSSGDELDLFSARLANILFLAPRQTRRQM